eukprot:TRINITY_DN32577_c0_g1_i1.p1 TRINITY_DN32577_c0_g1~~TRINITY_DN32577_c0_g1_i1.p1  ORF type:complete len:455 (+),score=157.58 TRINITY_DN32577_c0_g1_i1:70-1434(+)
MPAGSPPDPAARKEAELDGHLRSAMEHLVAAGMAAEAVRVLLGAKYEDGDEPVPHDVARRMERAERVRELCVHLQLEACGGHDSATGRSEPGISLFVVIAPHDRVIPLELPLDASVSDLKEAVLAAGGPPPPRQILMVGAQELTDPAATPLSDTELISNEVRIHVMARQTLQYKSISAAHRHGVALLGGGAGVVGWGEAQLWSPLPDFSGRTVLSVHAGRQFSAAIVDSAVEVWGPPAAEFNADLQQLAGRKIVCCSASVKQNALVAVDAGGCVAICGPDKGTFGQVPPDLQGQVAAAACGYSCVVVLLRDGSVAFFGHRTRPTRADLGGRSAVSVSSGWHHSAALLDDGSVHCFGRDQEGQCRAPPLNDVVSCDCGKTFTVALRRNGSVVWWGEGIPTGRIASAAPCAAVAAGRHFTVAVTPAGDLVADGGVPWGDFGQLNVPTLSGDKVVIY